MDAPMTAREAAENISDGLNCLHAIAGRLDPEDGPEVVSLSKMKDALSLLRSGTNISYSNFVIDEEMIAKLDELIALVGPTDSVTAIGDDARESARQYIRYIELRWYDGKSLLEARGATGASRE